MPRWTQTLEERFWAKVDVRGPDECWEWRGSRDPAGYGHIWMGRRSKRGHDVADVAHRVSWRLAGGALPPGAFVCHRCDNPPCVNPAHLFVGSQSENLADMWTKGRGKSPIPRATGERHGNAKLTWKAVREIRARYAAGTVSQHALAREHGVSAMTINHIVRGLVWTDDPAPPVA